MHLWPGYAHSFIAQERGFFEAEGVNVELKLVEGIQDNLELFINRKVDAAFGLQSDAMRLAAIGLHLKVVYLPDFSSGGDVIVSQQAIKTVADLKGKKIGVEGLNNFNHIFVVNLLKNNGLTESDVIIVPVPAPEVINALDNGIIDAGLTWEPTQSQAIAKGYRLLASTADAPGIVTDVLMFHSDVIEQRSEDVKKIVRSLFRAQEFLAHDETTAYAIMSEATGITPGSLRVTHQGIILPNLEAHKAAFKKSEHPYSFYKSGKFISDFFVEKGVIKDPINIDMILAPEIINGI